MCITNLIVKLKPEEIPKYMRGKFFELFKPEWDNEKYPSDSHYMGWVEIREDGTIEFGEPGA